MSLKKQKRKWTSWEKKYMLFDIFLSFGTILWIIWLITSQAKEWITWVLIPLIAFMFLWIRKFIWNDYNAQEQAELLLEKRNQATDKVPGELK